MPAAADVLDTAQVSGKVLHLLQLYKIPISQFGLHVLERSQGRTSELLNKPKPFEKLSQDGREVYRKMKRWLEQEDPIGYVRRKIVQGATLLSPLHTFIKSWPNYFKSQSVSFVGFEMHRPALIFAICRVSSNNSRGRLFLSFTPKGDDYWREGDYFKYCPKYFVMFFH